MKATVSSSVLLAVQDMITWPRAMDHLGPWAAVSIVILLWTPVAVQAGQMYTSLNKWYKVACIAENLKETDTYICDDHGYVHCLPGWKNEKRFCKEPICNPSCVPGQGRCTKPNTCTCEVGWTASDCSKCVALPGCVNGNCRIPYECTCQEGWTGMLCDQPICRKGCANGMCSRPGECVCQPGWTGPLCNQCIELPGCSQHGFCTKPLECKCRPGYGGHFCQNPVCRPGCHRDHGFCKVPGECICYPGWQGQNCNQCVRYPGCANGVCELPWECKCNPGWFGALCDRNTAQTTPKVPYPTGVYPTEGYPTGVYPTGVYPTGGYPTNGYPSGAYPTGGYPSGGYPTGGYPTNGYTPYPPYDHSSAIVYHPGGDRYPTGGYTTRPYILSTRYTTEVPYHSGYTTSSYGGGYTTPQPPYSANIADVVVYPHDNNWQGSTSYLGGSQSDLTWIGSDPLHNVIHSYVQRQAQGSSNSSTDDETSSAEDTQDESAQIRRRQTNVYKNDTVSRRRPLKRPSINGTSSAFTGKPGSINSSNLTSSAFKGDTSSIEGKNVTSSAFISGYNVTASGLTKDNSNLRGNNVTSSAFAGEKGSIRGNNATSSDFSGMNRLNMGNSSTAGVNITKTDERLTEEKLEDHSGREKYLHNNHTIIQDKDGGIKSPEWKSKNHSSSLEGPEESVRRGNKTREGSTTYSLKPNETESKGHHHTNITHLKGHALAATPPAHLLSQHDDLKTPWVNLTKTLHDHNNRSNGFVPASSETRDNSSLASRHDSQNEKSNSPSVRNSSRFQVDPTKTDGGIETLRNSSVRGPILTGSQNQKGDSLDTPYQTIATSPYPPDSQRHQRAPSEGLPIGHASWNPAPLVVSNGDPLHRYGQQHFNSELGRTGDPNEGMSSHQVVPLLTNGKGQEFWGDQAQSPGSINWDGADSHRSMIPTDQIR